MKRIKTNFNIFASSRTFLNGWGINKTSSKLSFVKEVPLNTFLSDTETLTKIEIEASLNYKELAMFVALGRKDIYKEVEYNFEHLNKPVHSSMKWGRADYAWHNTYFYDCSDINERDFRLTITPKTEINKDLSLFIGTLYHTYNKLHHGFPSNSRIKYYTSSGNVIEHNLNEYELTLFEYKLVLPTTNGFITITNRGVSNNTGTNKSIVTYFYKSFPIERIEGEVFSFHNNEVDQSHNFIATRDSSYNRNDYLITFKDSNNFILVYGDICISCINNTFNHYRYGEKHNLIYASVKNMLSFSKGAANVYQTIPMNQSIGYLDNNDVLYWYNGIRHSLSIFPNTSAKDSRIVNNGTHFLIPTNISFPILINV